MIIVEFNPTLSELIKLHDGVGVTCISDTYCGSDTTEYVLVRTPEFEIQLCTFIEPICTVLDGWDCEDSCDHEKVEITLFGITEKHPQCIIDAILEDYEHLYEQHAEKGTPSYIIEVLEKFVTDNVIRLVLAFRDEDEYCDDHDDNAQYVQCSNCLAYDENCDNCTEIRYTKEMAMELVKPYMEQYIDETGIISRMVEEYFTKPPMTKAAR